MPLIWCAISSHGLGHAAQIVPVLNELGRIAPDLRATLRTQVPSWFFQDRLTIDWTLSSAEQDIGCIQHGPLQIDITATWDAHARFHEGWERMVLDEIRAIRAAKPSFVLSDIPYLAIEAGAAAGVPTVGLCNLSWDQVLEPLAQPGRPDQREIIAHIQRAYAHADLMLRPTPGIPLSVFQKVTDIGPIARPLAADPDVLKRAIGAKSSERTVLVGFGGIALDTLPFEQLEQLTGYRFIVSGPVPASCDRCHAADSIPLPFGTLLASADILITKPGYSTVVEAVALGKPVVYVRRYNFSDEQALVDYLHRHGRAAELSARDFADGRWEPVMTAALAAPAPKTPAPAPRGAAQAARILLPYLDGRR